MDWMLLDHYTLGRLEIWSRNITGLRDASSHVNWKETKMSQLRLREASLLRMAQYGNKLTAYEAGCQDSIFAFIGYSHANIIISMTPGRR